MRGRLPLVIGVAIALVGGLSACTFGGNAQETNLANQRKAALFLIANQSGIERIRFTDAGGPPGFGVPWHVGAVVTIGDTEYQEILSLGTIGGDRMPRLEPQATPTRVTVIYSDDSSEVIE